MVMYVESKMTNLSSSRYYLY